MSSSRDVAARNEIQMSANDGVDESACCKFR